jgi:hypothetical protein
VPVDAPAPAPAPVLAPEPPAYRVRVLPPVAPASPRAMSKWVVRPGDGRGDPGPASEDADRDAFNTWARETDSKERNRVRESGEMVREVHPA